MTSNFASKWERPRERERRIMTMNGAFFSSIGATNDVESVNFSFVFAFFFLFCSEISL